MNLKEIKMKKIFIGTCIILGLSGCGNRCEFDINYTFNKAYVRWPDGTLKVISIKKWRDYSSGQIQIFSQDGKIYRISSINSVLVAE